MLFSIIFTTNIRIDTFFVYYKHMNREKKQLPKKVLFLKQHFTEHIKMTVKRINVKNRTFQFLNGMINIKNFDSKLLKIKTNDDYEKIYNVNPLNLIVNTADGHIEEKDRSKYLTFAFTGKNKEVLKIHKTLG